MLKVFSVTLLLMLVGCSSPQTDSNSGLENVYISGGTEKYYLGIVPHWANFSTWASCQRNAPIRYLNFENIKKSYNLDYKSAVHMQHMINRKISAFVKSTGGTQLPAKDETFIFNNVYAQVLGGSYDFTPPRFNNVSLIWIDPYVNNTRKLKKIMSRNDVLSGHPVLISNCLNSFEVEALIEELELEDLGAKVISSEMFSTYDTSMKKSFDFGISLSEIMGKKTMTFYGPRLPEQVRGTTKTIIIK